jgi:hypothetical protein
MASSTSVLIFECCDDKDRNGIGFNFRMFMDYVLENVLAGAALPIHGGRAHITIALLTIKFSLFSALIWI